MGDVAVAPGDRDEQRRDGQGDQRKLPVVEEEDHGHADDRHDVLDEEDEAVAEEEADVLQIHGRSRHELAGLVAIEVAKRQSLEVPVERVSHVELDTERLRSCDEPPPDHEERPQQPDEGDEPNEQCQLLCVLVRDRPVDDLLCQPGNRHGRGLRSDCQSDGGRDGQTVGAQEAKQPYERAETRRLFGHRDRVYRGASGGLTGLAVVAGRPLARGNRGRSARRTMAAVAARTPPCGAGSRRPRQCRRSARACRKDGGLRS